MINLSQADWAYLADNNPTDDTGCSGVGLSTVRRITEAVGTTLLEKIFDTTNYGFDIGALRKIEEAAKEAANRPTKEEMNEIPAELKDIIVGYAIDETPDFTEINMQKIDALEDKYLNKSLAGEALIIVSLTLIIAAIVLGSLWGFCFVIPLLAGLALILFDDTRMAAFEKMRTLIEANPTLQLVECWERYDLSGRYRKMFGLATKNMATDNPFTNSLLVGYGNSTYTDIVKILSIEEQPNVWTLV